MKTPVFLRGGSLGRAQGCLQVAPEQALAQGAASGQGASEETRQELPPEACLSCPPATFFPPGFFLSGSPMTSAHCHLEAI